MGIKCLYTQSPVPNFYRKDYSTYKLEILNPQKINLLAACRLLPTRWINTIEMYSLIVLEASILTSRYPQDHAASKGSKEDSFLSLCIFWWFTVILGIPCLYLHITPTCPCLHIAFLPCVFMSSPLHIKTTVTGFRVL